MRSVILVLVFLAGCGDVYVEEVNSDVGFDDVSIFRQTGRRQIQGTQGSSTIAPEVKSYDEFIAALTSLPDADLACRGKSIIVAADIVFPNPAILSHIHSGLTIVGIGRPKLIGVDGVFDVDGSGGDVERVTISSVSLGTQSLLDVIDGDMVDLTVSDIASTEALDGPSLQTSGAGSEIRGGQILNSVFGSLSGSFREGFIISANIIFTGISLGESSSLAITGNHIGEINKNGTTENIAITGNVFNGSGISMSGTITTTIVGNALGGGSISVGVGGGQNVIVGNANVSAITSGGTDVSANNT